MEKIEYLYEEAILFDYISMVEGYVSQYKKNKIIFNWIKEQIFSLKMKYRKYKLKVPDLILTIAFIQFSLEDIETIFYQELKKFQNVWNTNYKIIKEELKLKGTTKLISPDIIENEIILRGIFHDIQIEIRKIVLISNLKQLPIANLFKMQESIKEMIFELSKKNYNKLQISGINYPPPKPIDDNNESIKCTCIAF